MLHMGNSCHLLVDGYASRQVTVTGGIRQGCPLAPTLFIIALDVFYRTVDAPVTVTGVHLRAAGQTHDVKVCGYADDTALYVTGIPARQKRCENSSGSALHPDFR